MRLLDERGKLEIRDASEGKPSRIEGRAVPYGETIDIGGARERFVYGAFADAVKRVNSGERLAYLTAHDGVPVAVIDSLSEKRDGLYFGAAILDDVPESVRARSAIAAGISGVSAEIIPGVVKWQGDIREHRSGVRLAAIAGSYAPAYKGAKAQLRDAARAVGGMRRMPNLSVAALTERRDAINGEISTIRTVAETEDRDLTPEERDEIKALEGRRGNVETLLTDAKAESERRDAERKALPSQAGSDPHAPAVVTRAESIYGPHTQRSYFADLIAEKRDANAAERMQRHRALVADLGGQLEKRAITSSNLAGAYPTEYYPDLYVPDVAFTGPFGGFFAVTPITDARPITVPTFGTVTGDTAAQAAENNALANVDMTTAPVAATPKTIGGEAIVSRQTVDGASPGADLIIATELRELLMRDTEREIALVLEALTSSGAIADTAGTGAPQSGRDLVRGIQTVLGQYYAGAAAGGAGARMLPAEGWFANSTDWGNLVAAEDGQNRPLMPYINPMNANGQIVGTGFQKGILGGTPVEPAWAILNAINHIVARRNDARQWKSTVLDVRLEERNGPVSIVFAVMQYFVFAVLQPKGVRRYTYTNA
jgi:phage head maturation protease